MLVIVLPLSYNPYYEYLPVVGQRQNPILESYRWDIPTISQLKLIDSNFYRAMLHSEHTTVIIVVILLASTKNQSKYFKEGRLCFSLQLERKFIVTGKPVAGA